MRRRVPFRLLDKGLLAAPLCIFLIGIAGVCSASAKDPEVLLSAYAIKQLLWMGIGVLAALFFARSDYYKWIDWVWPLYGVTLVLLVTVFLMPARMGAHRWIGLGAFNLQPSELAKIAVIAALARYMASRRVDTLHGFQKWTPFAIVGVPFMLILRQPDLGTGLLLVPPLLCMLYLWGFGGRKIVGLMTAGMLAAPVLALFLKDYQRSRLLVFLDPNLDPLGAGYTIIQSKIAIGSGGLMGKGFMEGTQNQLKFLPESHTDFVFGVLAEEGGFLGALILVALFGYVVWKGFNLAAQTPDRFGSLMACGLSALFGSQAIINLGMTMGLFPVVGVPLPLASYGGTSAVVTMVSIGILLNIKAHRSFF